MAAASVLVAVVVVVVVAFSWAHSTARVSRRGWD